MVNMVIIGANVGRSQSDAAWVQVRKNGWRGLFVESLPAPEKEHFNTVYIKKEEG